MPVISTLLAVLTPFERDHFFPAPMLAELQACAADFKLLDPTGMDAAEWQRHLRAINPAVLLSCWQTRPLPPEPPPTLRYLCHVTGSVRHLVTRAQLEHGLLVTNWGNAISRTVAECALFHILACLRRANHWHRTLHDERGWKDGWEQVGSLFERRVGVHGYGAIAHEFIKLLAPFNCRVSVLAPDFDEAAAHRTGCARSPSLAGLFADNDIVVELAPRIPATIGSVTEEHLRRIRPGGIFVNVARAAITDEAALLRVAREGRISVGLDVYVQEPLPPDSPWRGLRNVSLSPHTAGPTLDRYPDAGARALLNLRNYSADQPLLGVVTPQAYDWAT